MINIDNIRSEFINIFYNHFKGNFNISLQRQLSTYSKFIKSNLFANVQPIEKYTRSIKYKIKFDKYEEEFIFYTSVNKSLEQMKYEFETKIQKIVIDTFIKNNDENTLNLYSYNVLDNINFDKLKNQIEDEK
jgi:hypothetical protein